MVCQRTEVRLTSNQRFITRSIRAGKETMPKFYVQSGRVCLVLDADSPRAAAIKSFEWTCEKQAEIEAASPLEHLRAAERHGWQLDDVILVNERGFGRADAEPFDTAAIVESWLSSSAPLG